MESSYITEQYIDWEWFEDHASYIIPAIIQIIFGEEIICKGGPNIYSLCSRTWRTITIKKRFSYNNSLRDISFVNYLKSLSESLT